MTLFSFQLRFCSNLALCGLALAAVGGCHAPRWALRPGDSPSAVVIAPEAGTPRPPFAFSPEDEALLDEIQRGCFNFFWNAGTPNGPAAMTPDRTSKDVVSVAGVGFQLSALCIGVERGWITREQGFERAKGILAALEREPTNRKAGMFYHFIDPKTAGQPGEAYEHVVSTIDSALLFAGVLTASQYFGGEVRAIGDRLFDEADWAFFVHYHAPKAWERGYLSLGWKPNDLRRPTGEGELLPYVWADCGDEHRLVTFLGVAATREAHRVDPALYYRLRRGLGEYKDAGTMVWFPWSGALFVSFFAHCWIDYARLGVDDPGAFGVEHRARVDFWENARRTTRLHQIKGEENPRGFATFGRDAWGLSASDVAGGYGVPGLFPTPIAMGAARAEWDYPTFPPKDNFGDGTIAPYSAGSCVMFDPARAIAALRHYRGIRKSDGTPLLWSDPARGGYGFADAYNLEPARSGGEAWVAPDHVAIDQGPLLLAIENARTGLIWQIFHAHPAVTAGLKRLRLENDR